LLKVRETLTVTNTDSDSYTLTTTPDAEISSTTVNPQETEYVGFPRTGTFILSSQEHPEAKATVIVSKTAGTTCGVAHVGTVSFGANYTDPKKHYFFTPTQMTVKVGQAITLSNLTDQELTITSKPDAGLGNIQIGKNQQQELRFTDEGTYTISCMQFPNEKFTITVRATDGSSKGGGGND
jgi:plastocyanin